MIENRLVVVRSQRWRRWAEEWLGMLGKRATRRTVV
jgi:hypothetical protein